MNEVTITADSRLEAVLRVRSELGAGAVIVSERRVPAHGLPGRLGKKVYEVVATAAPQADAPEAVPVHPEEYLPDAEEIRQEIMELREMVSDLQGRRAVVMAPSAPPQAHRSWRALGVEPDEIGPAAEHAPTPECLRAMLPEGGELTVSPATQYIALIGPPGSGKTSVAAKLAFRFREVAAVLSLDCYRVGGPADLRAYCAAIEVPFEAASSCEDAMAAAKRLPIGPTPQPPPARGGGAEPTPNPLPQGEGAQRIVFIDTSAVQPGEGVRFEELRLALTELGAKSHLVLSAAAKPKDMLQAVDLASALAPDRVVFTQLDLTADWGAMLAAGARWGIPISYVSSGPRVPTDLGPASADLLVAEILRRVE